MYGHYIVIINYIYKNKQQAHLRTSVRKYLYRAQYTPIYERAFVNA
jgi:hypothetical protein